MKNYKLWFSGAFGAVLGGTVIYLSLLSVTDIKASSINLLLVVLGLALGWLFGILLSPYTTSEKNRFSEYSKAFGVFASGYLIGKIDKVLEEILKTDFLFDSVHGFRVMAFLASFIISLVVTFVFRSYDN